jgi:Asp-tRNA(Asn)/Glu-tRNA(Gln) amidotransferase A subunit family amidase
MRTHDDRALETYASVQEISDRIRDRTSSPVDVIESYLARIAALNPSLNAFITVLGRAVVTFTLPRQGVSLVQLVW